MVLKDFLINVGVIGCGYWGERIIKTLYTIKDVHLTCCCDINLKRLKHIKTVTKNIDLEYDYKKLVSNPSLDALIIATNAESHFKIANKALMKKHVFIEKPMALKISDAKKLIKLAKERKKVLMGGHQYLYHSAIQRIKKIVKSGYLGKILYMRMIRTHLGSIRNNINVLQELAPHDVAIMLFLLGEKPKMVSARGMAFGKLGREDFVNLVFSYSQKLMVDIQFSWIDPERKRSIVIVGDRRSIIFDDAKSGKKLEVVDYGVSLKKFSISNRMSEQLKARHENDIIIKYETPLKNELNDFFDCVRTGKKPLSDGQISLEVLKLVEYCQKSLKTQGKPVVIG